MRASLFSLGDLNRPVSGASLGAFRWAMIPALNFQFVELTRRLAEGYSEYPRFFSEFRLPLGTPEIYFSNSFLFFVFNLILIAVFAAFGLCFAMGWRGRWSAASCAAVLFYFLSLDVSFDSALARILVIVFGIYAALPTAECFSIPGSEFMQREYDDRWWVLWAVALIWVLFPSSWMGLILLGGIGAGLFHSNPAIGPCFQIAQRIPRRSHTRLSLLILISPFWLLYFCSGLSRLSLAHTGTWPESIEIAAFVTLPLLMLFRRTRIPAVIGFACMHFWDPLGRFEDGLVWPMWAAMTIYFRPDWPELVTKRILNPVHQGFSSSLYQ